MAARGSVGTSIDLRSATEVLFADFAQIASVNAMDPNTRRISVSDLQRVGITHDSMVPDNLRQAANFFIASPVDRRLLSAIEVEQDSINKSVGKPDIENLLRILSSGRLETVLLQTARNRNTGAIAFDVILRDPGVPSDVREHLLSHLSDEQVLSIVGRPDMRGDAQDVAEETSAFLGLAKLSWLGFAEAEVLVRYKVPFVIDRGSKDADVSFWNGDSMHISEKMELRAIYLRSLHMRVGTQYSKSLD